MWAKIKRFLFPIVCQHKFRYKDLKLTGIPELKQPVTNDYHQWQKYYLKKYNHPSVTQRVQWPCCKCHKMSTGHYRLQILEHGRIAHEKETNENT